MTFEDWFAVLELKLAGNGIGLHPDIPGVCTKSPKEILRAGFEAAQQAAHEETVGILWEWIEAVTYCSESKAGPDEFLQTWLDVLYENLFQGRSVAANLYLASRLRFYETGRDVHFYNIGGLEGQFDFEAVPAPLAWKKIPGGKPAP